MQVTSSRNLWLIIPLDLPRFYFLTRYRLIQLNFATIWEYGLVSFDNRVNWQSQVDKKAIPPCCPLSQNDSRRSNEPDRPEDNCDSAPAVDSHSY